jgi:hypothetical protein
MNKKPPLITWFTCLLLLSACGAQTTPQPTPSVDPGPVTISAEINSDGITTLSGTDFPLVNTKGLGVGWWELSFAATLYEAKDKQHTLYILHQERNGEVIRQEYAIGRPFEINFNNDQWVKKIDHDGNGNAVVYVEPTAGSSAPTASSPAPTASKSTPTMGSSAPTAVAATAVPTSTTEVVVLPDLGLSNPVDFINFYFKNINDRNYQMTWSLLSQNFINIMNSPSQGGYQGYVDFWNTARQVEIIDIVIESQNDNSATVNVNMTVRYENGITTSGYQHFSLIYEKARNTWLFDG